jgi:hypothetical protein
MLRIFIILVKVLKPSSYYMYRLLLNQVSEFYPQSAFIRFTQFIQISSDNFPSMLMIINEEALSPLCLLGAFEKLRKATDRFVVSVHPSYRMKQLSSHWTDYHEIWYLCIFRKSVEKIQTSLKSDNNNGYLTWRSIYIFDHISLTS